jgi:hypothetical protein
MKVIRITVSLLALSLCSSLAIGKVASDEAAKLGNELTAIGAQTAGNAAGTIPAYTGGLPQNTSSDPYKNVFADEKPLFEITASNLDQYKANLTAGQRAMFAKYPNTYVMPIYESHRTAKFPDFVLKKAKMNATTGELLPGGNGLNNFDETVPFAIPKSGLEVIWNHITRYRGGSVQLNRAQMPVQKDGSFTAQKIRAQFTPPQYLKDGYDEEKDKNILFYYKSSAKAPPRLTGNVLLVHETIDQISEPRRAWEYNAGQRRVRRAPKVAYDSPNTEGMRTSDQVDMYNGAPNRYDWTIVGKKEVYIPYNSYKLMDENSKYDDIITPGHINQEYTRYELHRVWHITATLKEGSHHIYSRRDLYIDEDSWQIAVADHYDTRGELWRVSEGHAMQFVNADALWYVSITNYDLTSGRYMVELNSEERNAFKFGSLVKRKDFSTSAIRRSGIR